MAKRGSKHAGRETQLSYTFGGGLNLADPANVIGDGQLSYCQNFVYTLGSGELKVRPGVAHVADTPASNAKMTNMHAFVQGVSASRLVASFDDGSVRYLSGANWTQFHTLTAPSVVPPLLTFNDKLIIGDIGTNLKSWDGSTVATLADSPKATALAEIGGRIAANSADDLDGIAFSVPENETNWILASGASFVRIGYGDGQRVVGFEPFGSDLAVFKAGDAGGRVMRLVNAALDETNWSAAPISGGMPLAAAQAVAFVGNNVLYGSTNGVMDLSGVQEYGSIKSGVAGRAINTALAGKSIRNISYIPSLALALVFVRDDYRIWVYHAYTGRWTMWDIGQKRFICACQLGSNVYLGAEDGTLYRLTESESVDELEGGSPSDISAMARGKQLVMRGEGIVKRARIFYDLESGASLELNAVGTDGLTRTTLLVEGQVGQGLLYDATGQLYDANQQLYSSSTWYRTGRARMREQSITVEIRSTIGRYSVRQVDLEIAQVNG